MPNISSIKPVIKITQSQFKQLMKRILDDKGAIKAEAMQEPVGPMVTDAMKTEIVPRGRTFETFDSPIIESRPQPINYPPEVNMPKGNTFRLLEPEQQSFTGPGFDRPKTTDRTVQVAGRWVPPTAADIIPMRSQSAIVGPSAIDTLQRTVNPVDKTMGRIFQNKGGELIPEDYPWEYARQLALKNPEKYIPENRPHIPPTTRIRTVPKESPENLASLTGDDYAKGIAYERLHWKPIENRLDQVSRAVIEETAKEVGVKVNKEKAADMALVFNEMWKKIGGMRTTGGQEWEQLRRTSRHAKITPDARTYFVKSASLWKDNPEGFKRQFPREAAHLEADWQKYMGVK
jgi:hypothetical protein